MPYHVDKTGQCPAGQPWGVINTTTGKILPGACHSTMEGANRQMRAVYANEMGAGMRSETRAAGTEVDFREEPTTPPPNDAEPWMWLAGRWWRVATDTSDGVAEDLSDLDKKNNGQVE